MKRNGEKNCWLFYYIMKMLYKELECGRLVFNKVCFLFEEKGRVFEGRRDLWVWEGGKVNNEW